MWSNADAQARARIFSILVFIGLVLQIVERAKVTTGNGYF